MQRHWKTVQWGSIVALAAFVASLMIGKYWLTYAIVASALMIGLAYLVAVAKFQNRPDGEDEENADKSESNLKGGAGMV